MEEYGAQVSHMSFHSLKVGYKRQLRQALDKHCVSFHSLKVGYKQGDQGGYAG